MSVFSKIVLVLSIVVTGSSSLLAETPFTLSLKGKSGPYSFADIIEPLLPAVVNISTTSDMVTDPRFPGFPGSPLEEFFRQFIEESPGFGRNIQPRKTSSLGSGFIIAQKGDEAFIVTCNHVIADADEIKVILHDDEKEFKAEVVGRDRPTDLAVLKIKIDRKLTIAEWGDSSKLRVGDWILAIGNPFGLSSTVTIGIVSMLRRNIDAFSNGMPDYIGSGYIQTTAAINVGSSGGPMFGVDGKVIAISKAILSPNGGNIGIGFGIPSDYAKNVIEKLMSHGKITRGWLGVIVQEITPEMAEALGLKKAMGALLNDVAVGSPAEKAGLKPGDVILKFKNVDVKEYRHLSRLVGEIPVGEEVQIVIWRDNKEQTFMIKVGEVENTDVDQLDQFDESESYKLSKENKTLGLVTQSPTPDLRERYKIPLNTKGIVITFVDPGSDASHEGLQVGDVILSARSQGKTIKTEKPIDFHAFITEARKNKKSYVLLEISRRGSTRHISLSLREKKRD